MQGFAAALAVLALLAMPLGVAGAASVEGTEARDLTPALIESEITDRFGGGAVVGVRAGDAVFGVRYGTADHPNNLVVFAEYKRFLGAADVVDNQGNLIRTHGVPVVTVLGQSLDAFIEFQDADGDGLLNFTAIDEGVLVRNDLPQKILLLNTSWSLDGPTMETARGRTYVNFTLAAAHLPYTLVWDPTGPHRGTEADGVLDVVAFRFKLEIDVVERTATVPWYRVSVDDGNERVITRVDFLGMRNVTGQAVVMGAKYDHDIRGWDFARDTDLLALETHLLFGNFFPTQVARFVHMVYFHDHAQDEDRTYVHNETTATPVRPHLYARDRVYFDDDWARVGRFEWASNVTVDGRDMTMSFQVQGGDRFFMERRGAVFLGFRVRGAFIYPSGQAIFHDPAVAAESFLPALPSGFTLTPLTLLAVQLGVVALAMGPALYLRAKARRRA